MSKHPSASILLFLSLAFLPVSALAELDLPVGGWRSGDASAPYTQAVNYPAVSPGIDAGVSDASQIRGRIRAQGKTATLVVNGNAMPQRLDSGGEYGRAYSFATGSNSVEIRSGNERQHVQFYQTSAGQAAARLRVILAWDSDGTDLDLHVITPRGEHAWYGERVISTGAIDLDVTTGFGPEIFSSPAPEHGLYQVYVNYYGSYEDSAITTARLTVVSNEGTPSERRQDFTVPMRFAGELTLVRQFMYP
ncbi:MAG: DUF2135 domain-containing protein [Azoarcus sp.]|jgi:uncharacterized protein YfaP (DUF2135 family)|nr:DUF2135 domain-containing protein [Azoarcus sp.]